MHGRNNGALYQFQAEADSDRGMGKRDYKHIKPPACTHAG